MFLRPQHTAHEASETQFCVDSFFLKSTCSYLHSQWSIKFWVISLPTPIHTLTYSQWALATPAPDFSLHVTVERFNIPKDKRVNIFSKDGHQLRLKVVTLQCQMKHVTLLFFFFKSSCKYLRTILFWESKPAKDSTVEQRLMPAVFFFEGTVARFTPELLTVRPLGNLDWMDSAPLAEVTCFTEGKQSDITI